MEELGSALGCVCCDRQGTRVIQKFVTLLESPKERELFLSGIKPNILEVLFSSFGSYVVDVVFDHFPMEELAFIVEVVAIHCKDLGVNQHGLCVLKKLVSKCDSDTLSYVANAILFHVELFANDQYGNYLLQQVLLTEDPSALALLHRSLQGKYFSFSRFKFSSNLVEKCLSVFDAYLREEVVAELMSGDIATLLQDSFGNYVMQNALQVSTGVQAQELISRIRSVLVYLRKGIQKKWEKLLSLVELDLSD